MNEKLHFLTHSLFSKHNSYPTYLFNSSHLSNIALRKKIIFFLGLLAQMVRASDS